MISGASRGIGEGIARRLLEDGYRLSLGVRDVAATRERYADIDDSRFLITHFEAADPATANEWLAATLAQFGELHALVNNAGIWRQVNFDEGDEAELDELWEVNVKAPFRLSRLALPELRKVGHGRIVNIASTDGLRFRDHDCSVGYTMSKHALVALSHATRHAAYGDGVRVTAVCPGAVATDMVAGIPGATPLAERLSPATIGHLVAMLLSLPNAASVAILPVNTRLESTI
jgi:NAD(P)-dependent dehydrogenase (short-subunit alcohol dehydrogenase family)